MKCDANVVCYLASSTAGDCCVIGPKVVVKGALSLGGRELMKGITGHFIGLFLYQEQ